LQRIIGTYATLVTLVSGCLRSCEFGIAQLRGPLILYEVADGCRATP
jgi:hypothetical protein